MVCAEEAASTVAFHTIYPARVGPEEFREKKDLCECLIFSPQIYDRIYKIQYLSDGSIKEDCKK